MQSMAKKKHRSLIQTIERVFLFSLSDKAKFAIKASLSMALAFLIPMSQGWAQPHTAAVTVMLIASVGPVGASVMKGLIRVIGTVIGATIGMTLIALFPQDRELYLIIVSVIVTIILYLARAYKGDVTVFLLTAITILLVFKGGEVDDIFIYGIDKTYMTVFGIVVNTLVGILIWPVHAEDNSAKNAIALTSAQWELYRERDGEREKRKGFYLELLSCEETLNNSILAPGSDQVKLDFTAAQWHDVLNNYKKIDAHLTLLSSHDKMDYVDDFPRYVKNYQRADKEIQELFAAISLLWQKQKEIDVPDSFEPDYQPGQIKELDNLDRASLTSALEDMKKIHNQLCQLAEKLNSIMSPKLISFEPEKQIRSTAFLWFDIEDLKGSLVTFLVFWTATLLWIYVNPPGGFMIVTLATGLSILTTFSPLKPPVLLIVFTMAFAFAMAMYILVLPNLHYGWELGLFIFTYAFIGFYFINPKLSVFFLLGMMTLGIANEMNYNFAVFLITLFIFYAFLFILLFFDYLPFSMKPEYLFSLMKKRFFKLSQSLLVRNHQVYVKKGTVFGAMAAKYSEAHLLSTVKKMQLWASRIDSKYFSVVDKKSLMGFSKECESFVYLLKMVYVGDQNMINNRLYRIFKEEYTGTVLADLVGEYALGKDVAEVDTFWRDEKKIIEKAEKDLANFLSGIDLKEYRRQEIHEFYEAINLRKNLWLSLFSIQEKMSKINFKVLEMNRF